MTLAQIKTKLLELLAILESMETTYEWDTPEKARHSARMVMDTFGLSWSEKDLLCAVIMAESGFLNTAKNENKNSAGVVTSTDWGICQINDRYHIGVKGSFPSVEYVLANPDKVVAWMVKMYKQGHLGWWCAFSNGSYKKYA